MFARTLLAMAAAIIAIPACAQPFPPHPGTTRNIAAACAGREGWADAAPPARVFGNTYYVGTCGITALLVETGAGLVLIDGGVPEAAPLVLANIRKLGFSPQQVRWILASHEHYDHVGALAGIQRKTGAQVIAGPFQSGALMSGMPDADDPQASLQKGRGMLPLRVARTAQNGMRQFFGSVTFTATATPAHSPGSTSWTWRECEGALCRTIAYADSATVISANGYRFIDNPGRTAAVRRGLAAIGALPCDIILTPHPSASGVLERLSGAAPLVASGSCRDYAAAAARRFDQRLADEAAPRKDK